MQCRHLVAELNTSATKCLHCISGKPVTQAHIWHACPASWHNKTALRENSRLEQSLPECKTVYQTGTATLKSRNKVSPVQAKSGEKCRSWCRWCSEEVVWTVHWCLAPEAAMTCGSGQNVSRPRPKSRGRGQRVSRPRPRPRPRPEARGRGRGRGQIFDVWQEILTQILSQVFGRLEN